MDGYWTVRLNPRGKDPVTVIAVTDQELTEVLSQIRDDPNLRSGVVMWHDGPVPDDGA